MVHSRHLFTHNGPVLIILQAGGVAHAGVWANRLLLHPQHGLRTGSQLELIRQAHARGYAVALVHANELLTAEEAELEAIDLVSTLCSPGTTNFGTVGCTRRTTAHSIMSNNATDGSVELESLKTHAPQSSRPRYPASTSMASTIATTTKSPVAAAARPQSTGVSK